VFELTQKAGRVAPFRPMVFIPQSAGFWGQNFGQQTLDIKKPGVPLQPSFCSFACMEVSRLCHVAAPGLHKTAPSYSSVVLARISFACEENL
jgi:hypothetical protein